MPHPPDGKPQGWHLEFIAGMHAGAQLALTPGRYRLGHAADSDIVLADPAVADAHLLLDIGASTGEAIAVAPLRVTLPRGIRRRRRWAAGQMRKLADGMVLQAGATTIRLHGPQTLPTRHPVAAVALIALICAFAAGASASYRLIAPADEPQASPPPVAVATPPAIDAEAAATALRARLAGDGLGESVAITVSQGVIHATAALTPAEQRQWRALQEWFDGAFGSRILLLAEIAAPADDPAPPLDVAAVAMLPTPHVITRAGERYMEGAMLDGGWTIERIGQDAVLLRNGARTLRISY